MIGDCGVTNECALLRAIPFPPPGARGGGGTVDAFERQGRKNGADSWRANLTLSACSLRITITIVATAFSDDNSRSNGAAARITGAQPVPDLTIDPDVLSTLVPSASEYQRIIMKDGVITFAEYERAAFDAVRCVDNAGAKAIAPPPNPSGAPPPVLTGRGDYQFAVVPRGKVDAVSAREALDTKLRCRRPISAKSKAFGRLT